MGLNLKEIEGGSKAWSPEALGDKIKGRIVSVQRKQQTDFTTGALQTWDNGDPRLQTVIELATDLRDSDDDDGVRTLYLKGGKNFEAAEGSGFSGEVALAAAAKEAGCTSIDEDATLTVVYTGKSKPTTRGYQPARLYTMRYEPPRASVSTSDLFDE
jgi:hypothetical protein